MADFETAIQDWFNKNGFGDCQIDYNDVFAYNYERHIVYIGIIEYEDMKPWLEQFLYEYGLDYVGILMPALCLLHELGHHKTNHYFSKAEIFECAFIKALTEDERESNIENMFQYWEIADEFAANMWAIDFINEHIETVEELCQIYIKYWNDFINESEVA